MSLTKTVSENLHALRVAKGLTQQELAGRAKITVSYVSMLERGNRSPPLETLEVLAKALKVPPLQLLEGTAEGTSELLLRVGAPAPVGSISFESELRDGDGSRRRARMDATFAEQGLP